MINKHELRIGNNLLFSVERKKNPISRFVTVTQIKGNEVVVKDMGFDVVFQYTDENINPIQLSPELLEKCGFVKEGKYKYVKDDLKFWVYVWTSDSITAETGDCDLGQLASLHQLQNLYFCLCGEELEVKM